MDDVVHVWKGGKPLGFVMHRIVKDGAGIGGIEYYVRIEKKDGTTEFKSFLASDYGGDVGATRDAAMKYRLARASELGMVLNRYRHEGTYIVVDMRNPRVDAKHAEGISYEIWIDPEDLPIIESRIWRVDPTHGYVVSTVWDAIECGDDDDDDGRDENKWSRKTILFHKMVFPGLGEDRKVGHADQTRIFDNRKSNLRILGLESMGRIKVFVDDTGSRKYCRWKVSWFEGGTRKYRSYSVHKYGHIVAREMAEEEGRVQEARREIEERDRVEIELSFAREMTLALSRKRRMTCDE